MKASMNIEQDGRRKKQIKAAIEKVNRTHGKTLKKLGGGVTEKFISQVNAFIGRYRGALKRLARK
jgi:hypothetical protein